MSQVHRAQRGFTLIELITVMILISVLAVVVLPRFDSLSTFDATGYSDQLKSVLRFSQKTALAQRRAVMVDFSGATPVLSYATGSNCTSAGTTLNYPTALRSRGGSTASPAPGGNLTTAWVCFDTLGKPFKTQASPTALTATGTISITNANTISIEPETGYVH